MIIEYGDGMVMYASSDNRKSKFYSKFSKVS